MQYKHNALSTNYTTDTGLFSGTGLPWLSSDDGSETKRLWYK